MPQLPDSPERDAYLALVGLNEQLTAEFAELFGAAGISLVQFNALRLLVQGPREGLRCQEIASGLLHRHPDVTRLVDRMESAGLVQRERSSEDRRVVRVRPSREGRRLCESLYAQVDRLHREQLGGLSGTELRTLAALLTKARAAAARR
jgi:MarR family transcriptional regulator, 2-MHQ and catechol-resistance regulon repressor